MKAPAGLSNVPRPHGFVGRERQLAALDAAFAEPGDVVVQALHGLGGVGKSTLAAYWASTRSGNSPQWWITAESPAALDAGLADFAVALHPVLQRMEMGADDLREWALLWLAAHQNWLIVLDNVNDPQHVRPLIERAGHAGRFLITSRRATGWHRLSSTVPLDVLEEAEAVELFTRILTHEKQRDSGGAAEVCTEVGFLPLAVEQAASYCAETGVSPRAYLDLLTSRPAEMFAKTAEDGDADRTIARIWSITLDRLKDTPLAGEVLRTLAWYAPDGIPCNLLDDLAYPPPLRTKAAQLQSPIADEVTGRRLQLLKVTRSYMEKLADPPALNTAIGRLAAYSMISEHDGAITVHRLVQTLARTPDPKDPHRRAKDVTRAQRIAANALAYRLPKDAEDPGTWPTWHSLLPHVIAHTDHTPPERETATTARLLQKASEFLREQGAVVRGTATGRRAAHIHERLLGKRHRTTLTSRNNLATAYHDAGDLKRAIALYESNLADTERILGTDHPYALTHRNNLARAYQDAGDLKRAIPLLESSLADSERILGTDHPNTLTRRRNLGRAYQDIGDLKRAIPLLESSLADTERILGTDHPDTLTSRNSLATAYRDAKDLKRAIPLYESNLADTVRILGTDHPDTLNHHHDLARAYQDAGDIKRAIPLLESNLADTERILGTDHPNTLTHRNNLATAYHEAGDLKRAIALYEVNLGDTERILGTEHPHALTHRNNLGRAYQDAGDLERALPLLESSLADSERILGTDHPNTLTYRNNLSRASQNAKGPHGRLG